LLSYHTKGVEPDFGQNAAFHSQLAPQYDQHLACNPYNTLARTAFHDLVVRYVPAGGIVLDFGCGTGLDAQYYARKGYRVLAYDNSPGMVARLEQRCRGEIAYGQIRTCSFAYPAFPAGLPPWPAAHAITANFGVLNSIRHLEPLFGHFARLLGPRGWLIVSVLNPLHWSKVRMPGWWRNALPHPTGPRLFVTDPYASYLHFVPALLRAARGFHAVGRAQSGTMVRYREAAPGSAPTWWTADGPAPSRLARLLWRTSACRLLGHFVFLVLRRDV
jgi:SAM-dependent methyltransferase